MPMRSFTITESAAADPAEVTAINRHDERWNLRSGIEGHGERAAHVRLAFDLHVAAVQ